MTAHLLERPGRDAPAETIAVRSAIAGVAESGVWDTCPPSQEQEIGGVRCLIFEPPAAGGVLLHFHGGGFRVGQPEQVARFASALAAHCSVRVICPAYRLAPEHPFPAGLNDGLSVLSALSLGSTTIVLSGDSAGGGLAASLALLAHDAGISRPAGLALLSPWLDMRLQGDSYIANAASDTLFSAEAAVVAAELYLQGHDPSDPLASPLTGAPDIFPATFVNVGDGEVLLDDAEEFARRLSATGVDVQLDVVPGMEHVAVTRDPSLIGAGLTLDRLAAFVSERMLVAATPVASLR